MLKHSALFLLLFSYSTAQYSSAPFKAMTMNTWNSGRNVVDGLEKIVQHIRRSYADIVALQGLQPGVFEKILDLLGAPWNGVEHSIHVPDLAEPPWFYGGEKLTPMPDMAVLSRFPIAPWSINETSAAIGCLVDLGSPGYPRFISVWSVRTDRKKYGPYFACNLAWEKPVPGRLREIEEAEGSWSKRIQQVEELLANTIIASELSRDPLVATPLLVMGDFNAPSHLDWTQANNWIHCGRTVEWPTSKLMERAGFVDAYRSLYPDPFAWPGVTWSTVEKFHLNEDDNPKARLVPEPQDRIDFIYYRSAKMHVSTTETYAGTYPISQRLLQHDVPYNDWPSDHYAVTAEFQLYA